MSGPVEPLPGCADDPTGALRAMFVDLVQGRRIAQGQEPALRPVFLKAHGCARGVLTVDADLPEELRVGFLEAARAQGGLTAWVRFSSDTVPTRSDLRTTLGIGIKLFGVPGVKLLADDSAADTQDLLLQNHDVFFVDTARDMCEFTRAGVVDNAVQAYLDSHPVTRTVLQDMAKAEKSTLTATYWSVLPYGFGDERHVKYKLVPAGCPDGDPGAVPPDEDPSFFRGDLRHRLAAGEAAFDLFVQLRTDPDGMPLDRATVRWEETASAPVRVARLTLHQQNTEARGQAAYGENLAFNPWHSLPEHRPAGSIAEARRDVYLASAARRRDANGVPATEPGPARPASDEPPGRDTRIVRAAIHPAIGVARVGDSTEGFFLAPEVDDAPTEASYKDATGALKRQAVRFRVYGFNAAGEPVAELTADNADLRWTVHVANKKAAWYQFQLALDIPEAAQAAESGLRNATVRPRSRLVIDPGFRSVRGRDRAGLPELRFDSATFMGTPVYLGELRTDRAGRLLFLGGRGKAASVDNRPATDYANNDGWHDDIADGPVRAEVRIDGRTIPVEPAWVVVAPPDYAPGLKSVRTLYDLLRDTYVTAGLLPRPQQVSFVHDVLPVLKRLCDLQWVNHGIAVRFGHGGRDHLLAPERLTRLASKDPVHKELRRQVWASLRHLDRDGMSTVPWPPVYGDAVNLPPVSPRQHLALSPLQYDLLTRWMDGAFTEDFDPAATPVTRLEDVPLAERPSTLDRAALSFCLADAFHPGCELTWPMRHATMYSAPFRIKHRDPDLPDQSYGRVLTPQAALGVDGPLYAQGPGHLTRWMAVPWHTDTASCRSGYDQGFGPRYDPYLPTFWPARVPNHVLAEEEYTIAMDPARPQEERRLAFERRSVWLRWLPTGYETQINEMVRDFGKLGIVERRPGPQDTPELPQTMLVESEVTFPPEPAPPRERNLITVHVPEAADPEVRADAVATAAMMAEPPDEEVSAGFINKMTRLSGRR